MHALNGLVAVVVSANMAYLACTIVLPTTHAKLTGLITCTLSVSTDTIKGAIARPHNLCMLRF